MSVFAGSAAVDALNWKPFAAGFGVSETGAAGVLLTLVNVANGFALGVSAGAAATLGVGGAGEKPPKEGAATAGA